MNKTVKRSLSLLMSMVMVLAVVPLAGSAQQLLETAPGSTDQPAESTEVISLREENVKHFDMGNGTFQAVAYGHPVHELDENGQWKDIDFSLTLNQTRGVSSYTNEAAGISFPSAYTPNQPIMTLAGESDSISMTLVTNASSENLTARSAGSAVAAEVTNPQNSFNTVEDASNATFSSAILYEDVIPGVDLEYIVDPGTVKENIIVKERANSYEYVFALNLDGLYPIMQGDGSINIYDEITNEEKYAIPAPFMYDALGNCSEEVSYVLSLSGQKYSLSVIANEDWINTEGRCFPITIDPTYTVSTETVEDTYIDSDSPNTTHGSSSMLWVRSNRITYIKTPTPSIPSSASLNWAYLTTYYYYFDHISSGYVDVSVHRYTAGTWGEHELTWNIASQNSNFGLADVTQGVQNNVGRALVHDFNGQYAKASNPGQLNFDITDTVAMWRGQSISNHGFGLKYETTSTNLSVVFKSAEASYAYRPRITYQYMVGDYYYTNYYDSSMSDRVNLIRSAVEAAQTAYFNQFGVELSTNGVPIYEGTLTNVPDDSYHNDIDSIYNELLKRVGASNERIVFWTDYPRGTYCTHSSGQCIALEHSLENDQYIAGVKGYGQAIHVYNLLPDNGNDGTDEACMAINLIHETAHTFGLEDDYTAQFHAGVGFQCVMEYYNIAADDQGNYYAETFYQSILNGADAFCESCEEKLRPLLDAQ